MLRLVHKTPKTRRGPAVGRGRESYWLEIVKNGIPNGSNEDSFGGKFSSVGKFFPRHNDIIF